MRGHLWCGYSSSKRFSRKSTSWRGLPHGCTDDTPCCPLCSQPVSLAPPQGHVQLSWWGVAGYSDEVLMTLSPLPTPLGHNQSPSSGGINPLQLGAACWFRVWTEISAVGDGSLVRAQCSKARQKASLVKTIQNVGQWWLKK